MREARDGVYEAGVIGEILRDMANADISGGRSMQGPSVEYLAKLLAAAVERVDVALSGLRPVQREVMPDAD